MPQTEQELTRLKDLRSRILGSWAKQHEQIPQILYHYTSADGLIGILTSKSMWLTDLRYMNDLSELQYSRDLVIKRLSARLEVVALTEIEREFVGRSSSGLNPSAMYPVFSASFCEEGNLLSQWRAYRGRGGGYAIGFDFFHLLRLLSRQCSLRKVIYDEVEQVRLIDSVIDEFLSALKTETTSRPVPEVMDSFLPHLCTTFRSVIGDFLVSLKHPDFREEREWRLVYSTSVNPTISRTDAIPRFRSYEGNVIQYFAVDFEKAIVLSRDDTYGHPFPIVELMIGPTVNADLNQESTRILLLSLNPDIFPNIKRSEIPLRWL